MDSFLQDDVAVSSQATPSVVKLQYNGAVYDNSIRILPTIDNKELYNAARNLANLPKDTPISLLRLDHKGELVTNPRTLIDGELLEIIEGNPDEPNVAARQTELDSASQTPTGSNRIVQSQSVRGTLQFLHIVEKLKRTKRTGWVNNNIKPAESIADHMYRMGIMALLIDEKTAGVNKDRCIKMAIVHDLAESLVGDITPFDGVTVEDKHTQERNAMHHLCNELLGWSAQAQEIFGLFTEYEAAATPEALLVKDFDKFEMIMQALEYEQSEDVTLEDFFAGTRGKFKHPMVTAWVNELEAERAQSRAIKS
ncbi:putative hydrolases of HD superfamily [Entomortierella parvispora]|uniref:5'-deoxynucleotidase n=1 Tax=Entomortierella parvispora TaxID=205924 RepID=A0A9P3H3B1_9FUNG|nr:putative hydrolases of HD superfamily [Entomortierella parvispora]